VNTADCYRLTAASGGGGGRWPGRMCSSRPRKTLRSSAACAATASAGDSNWANAMPFDLRVVLRAAAHVLVSAHNPSARTRVWTWLPRPA